MRNSECGIRSVVFRSPLGWAGVAASEKGITMIALPRQSKHAVQQELDRVISPLTPAGSTERFGPERLTAEGLAEVLSRGGRGSLMSSEFRARSSEKEVEQLLHKAVVLLKKYFSGEVVSFYLPINLRCYTRFQRAAWKAAAEIPYGETRSYAWIAKRIRKPLAARAVGQAMGANPVPIIIP